MGITDCHAMTAHVGAARCGRPLRAVRSGRPRRVAPTGLFGSVWGRIATSALRPPRNDTQFRWCGAPKSLPCARGGGLRSKPEGLSIPQSASLTAPFAQGGLWCTAPPIESVGATRRGRPDRIVINGRPHRAAPTTYHQTTACHCEEGEARRGNPSPQ